MPGATGEKARSLNTWYRSSGIKRTRCAIGGRTTPASRLLTPLRSTPSEHSLCAECTPTHPRAQPARRGSGGAARAEGGAKWGEMVDLGG